MLTLTTRTKLYNKKKNYRTGEIDFVDMFLDESQARELYEKLGKMIQAQNDETGKKLNIIE